MKIHNFSAGPAILPREVIEKAGQAVLNFQDSGLSILEVSHRGKLFEPVMAQAEANVRSLLGIDNSFGVVFLTGGASSQFYQVAMNILDQNEKAAYVNTGTWATKAIEAARDFGTVEEIASSKDKNFSYIPENVNVPSDSKFLHLTSNNTIFGTQFQSFPEKNGVPVICDMSSDIFSRPIDMNYFDMIYAGAQKNMGPAGTTLVVIKKDLLGKVSRKIPVMLDYRTHIENGSMYNTPPVFPIYVSMLTMQWVIEQGGLEAMQTKNEAKAAILYNEIDANPLFTGTVNIADRSRMNVCFVPVNKDHEKPFMDLCTANGIQDIKGHRSVGGYRASIYNAMPNESVQLLADLMKEFAQKNG